jgi:hypothetical protein
MYSNGIKISEVLTAINGRLGWRQGTLSGVPVLSSDNKTSNSGRYFNDFHGLVTVKNIKDTLEDPAISDADFNTYLINKKQSVIAKVLNDVFEMPQHLEKHLLFERIGYQDTTATNNGKFVGYKIKPAVDAGIVVQINSLSLLMDGAKTFNVYLFHDSLPTYLKVKSVTTIANREVQVDLTDWYCSHINSSVKGGAYYVGYFQDDLDTVQAINIPASFQTAHCFSYHSAEYNHDGIDVDFQNSGLTGNTRGLNLYVSAFKDFTNHAVQNVSQFDNAVGLGMAIDILQGVVYSTRSNTTERVLQDHIATAEYDLTGSVPVAGTAKKVGLIECYAAAIQALKKSFYPEPKAQTVNLC